MNKQRTLLIEHLNRVHKFTDVDEAKRGEPAWDLHKSSDDFLDALHDIEHDLGHLARIHMHDYATANA